MKQQADRLDIFCMAMVSLSFDNRLWYISGQLGASRAVSLILCLVYWRKTMMELSSG